MTAVTSLPPASNTTTDAGQADRALLSALKVAVGGVSTEICRKVVDVVMQARHKRLGSLLRAAAVQGLDDTAAAHVGAQIDAALQAQASASFVPPAISIARDDQGRVDFRCVLDLAQVDVTLEGNGYRAGRVEGAEREPQPRHFSATVSGIPSPTFVLPPPQMIFNTGGGSQKPTRQVVKHNAQGDIEEIVTYPIEPADYAADVPLTGRMETPTGKTEPFVVDYRS